MRVVLDTNIFVSALAIPGSRAERVVHSCAIAGSADLIVTGDKAVLDLHAYEGVSIVSLRTYLET